MQREGQLGFVASCCERAGATCIAYADMAYLTEESELVKQATELAWRASLEPPTVVEDRSLANEVWRFARMDTDPAQPLSAYVPDCASAVYFSSDFRLTASLVSACESARWVFEAVAALVSKRSGLTSGPAELWSARDSDRSIQRELRKQEADLSTLEAAGRPDAALIKRLRADSARLGQLMLQEFMAEAQNRLRRGPPPRVWPDPEPEGDPPPGL